VKSSISNDLQDMIEQIKQDKWFISKEKNKALESINQMKSKIKTWNSLINPGKLMNDNDKKELNSYDINSLTKNSNYLIYMDIKIEYVEDDSYFGLGNIIEINKLEVNKSNNLSLEGILRNEQGLLK
jgi:hypothetical protein